MSNLKLPTMAFDSFAQNLGYVAQVKTIAYATTAEYVAADGSTDAYVIIRHHGTIIAEIARGWVYVTNASYFSQTTRNRIHKILVDNKQDYGFLTLDQTKGDQVLSFRQTDGIVRKDRILTTHFLSAHWDFENRTVEMRAEDVEEL